MTTWKVVFHNKKMTLITLADNKFITKTGPTNCKITGYESNNCSSESIHLNFSDKVDYVDRLEEYKCR